MKIQSGIYNPKQKKAQKQFFTGLKVKERKINFVRSFKNIVPGFETYFQTQIKINNDLTFEVTFVT